MTASPTSELRSQGDKTTRRLGLPCIGFVGKAGAGKSTAAQYLVKQQAYRGLSFAEPLKNMAVELWGEDARSDRDKLQKLGVSVREIEQDTWVRILVELAQRIETPVVIDDCRFPNEWWALKGLGFVMVRVFAPEHYRVDRLKKNGKWQNEQQLWHESETALDDFDIYTPDYVISNWESLEELHKEVFRVISKEVR